MFKEHNKITTGFVIQKFVTLPNGTMVCQAQEFVAGDPVDYEDMDGNPIEVDTEKEVYCPFGMMRPKQIPDPTKEAKFVCPDCGGNRIEACLDGSHTTIIDAIWRDGGIEYGSTDSNGDLDRFQCVKCGYVIENDGELILDDDELVEWVEAQEPEGYIDPRYLDDNVKPE